MSGRNLDLSTPIDTLKSIGPKNAARLKKLGITTVRHLLWHLPARYEDFSQTVPIGELTVGTKATVQGEVVKVSLKRIFPRHMTIVDALIKDESGAVKAVWFNQPFIANAIPEGTLVSLAGKVNLDKRGLYLSSPTYERIYESHSLRHTAGLIPVYPETAGITSKYLRFLIKPILESAVFEDPLPPSIRTQYDLVDLATALRSVHYPEQGEDVERAKKRLAFDDLLLFQLKALLERRTITQLTAGALPFEPDYIKKAIASLPFSLTGDQKIAAWEILSDLQKPYPMNRLLEGDVGSGKTVVALLGALQAAHHGIQSVFMAPTEVLAQQHYRTVQRLTEPFKIDVALLTGSQSLLNGHEIRRAALKQQIARGTPPIVIGTHAVIQKDMQFGKLGLVIVDEQHRFGIAQRSALVRSTSNGVPHLLSMTATPIPRTLALTIFGDLDISLIQEKPKERKEIITKIVGEHERASAYQFIDEQIGAGRQVFVICPRVEIADAQQAVTTKAAQSKFNILWAEVKAVTAEYERLSKEIFPHRKVAMLHGKMKPKEKQAIMAEFARGWHDILVATSVIEVGVDVPNASIIMIEGADRFGLAQLHQFRGRVGRAEHQSYCFLLPTSLSQHESARLKAVVKSQNGFELAEHDMKLRGPGEFFGVKQSGMPDLTMAALADMDLIKKARTQARVLLKEDARLSRYPLLRQRLEEFRSLSHFE